MTSDIQNLTEQELALYLVIKAQCKENGVCKKSTKELGKASHISKTEIPKLKKELAKKSLITIEKIVHEDGSMEPDNLHLI